jgi:hypothetical protein
MNKLQENRLNMFLAVKAYLLTKLTVLGALPNFTAFFTAFQELLAAIHALLEKQSFDKKGLTDLKRDLKLNLTTITGDNARKLYAYALYINDHVLIAETHIPQSKLELKSDAKLIEIAEGIYNRAALHLADVTTYGITTATQLAFRTAIDNFAGAMSMPRLSDAESKEITRQLADDYVAADKLLAQLDALLEIIRYSDPNTYKAYKLARKTIGYGTRTIAARGKVVDAVTKVGIKGVSVTFLDGEGVSLVPAVVKKTAAKGGFNVKSLAEGIYKFKLIKVGYVEQLINVTVNSDELCNIKVEMNKI